jgi:translation initiation factor 2-alpha kinase 4
MEGTEFVERLTPIFARINWLMAYLQCFDVKRKVYVNPLGSLNDKFFRGSILFQCVFDNKRRDVFAAGGRYDSLVQEFCPKVLASRPQTHAVGFNLSWDRLSSAMLEYLKGSARSHTKHTEAEPAAFWKTRRVSEHYGMLDYSPLIFGSAMYLLRALTRLFYVPWASKSFKIYGPMTSVLS